MRPRLTARGHGFLALGVATVVVGASLGFPDVTRIGALLAVLPALAMLLAWLGRPRLAVTRQITTGLAFSGHRVGVALVVTAAGRRRSAPLLAEERLDRRLGPPRRCHLPRLRAGAQVIVPYDVQAQTRGRHVLGPLAVFQHDPFGLISSGQWLSGTSEVLVLPRVVPLERQAAGAGGQRNDGVIAPAMGTRGEDDVTVRDYRAGDEIRRVHWASTARRGELMVRQEEQPRQRRAVVVLDTRDTVFGLPDDAFEWAVSATASVIDHLDRSGWMVHLVTADRLDDGAERPVSSQDALRHLALIEPRRGDEPRLASVARGLAESGGLVVVIAGDDDPEHIGRLTAVRRPGATGVMLVLATQSFDGTSVPEATDAESAALLRMSTDAGWRGALVRRGDDIAQVWRETVSTSAVSVPSSAPAAVRS